MPAAPANSATAMGRALLTQAEGMKGQTLVVWLDVGEHGSMDACRRQASAIKQAIYSARSLERRRVRRTQSEAVARDARHGDPDQVAIPWDKYAIQEQEYTTGRVGVKLTIGPVSIAELKLYDLDGNPIIPDDTQAALARFHGMTREEIIAEGERAMREHMEAEGNAPTMSMTADELPEELFAGIEKEG